VDNATAVRPERFPQAGIQRRFVGEWVRAEGEFQAAAESGIYELLSNTPGGRAYGHPTGCMSHPCLCMNAALLNVAQ